MSLSGIAILCYDEHTFEKAWSSWIQNKQTQAQEASMYNFAPQNNTPTFPEVARTIVELTQNRTLVAHDAAFVFKVLKNLFADLGFEFSCEKICTLRLWRKKLQDVSSFKLHDLIAHFHLQSHFEERLLKNADYIVQLFQQTQNTVVSNENKQSFKKLYENLLDECGVYYFFNAQNELIYIGKSKNIKSRIQAHFNNTNTERAVNMKSEVWQINAEYTGSELVALLLESHQIKQHKPKYNRAQRRSRYPWAIVSYQNAQNYLCFDVARTQNAPQAIMQFSSLRAAKSFLAYWREELLLCDYLCHLSSGKGACFHYSLHSCLGACIQVETAESYNERANLLVEKYAFSQDNFLIIDKGRTEGEYALILIENSHYKGWGYTSLKPNKRSIKKLKQYIQHYPETKDTRQILKQWLRENSPKIIYF